MKSLASSHHNHEKLIALNTKNLSDIELLATFIHAKNKKKSSQQLALDLITHFGNLRAVLTADFRSFHAISGLSHANYLRLQAAMEICRRNDYINLLKDCPLTDAYQTHIYLKRQLRDRRNETFVALFLDNNNRILAYEELFTGTINLATVYPRTIVEWALKFNAAAIILAHNHPSGSVDASKQDIILTKKLTQALDLIDVRVLDHLIIGDNEVYSILGKQSGFVIRGAMRY